MQCQKSVMIVLTEIQPRTGASLTDGITCERIHRTLNENGVLAIPGNSTPKLFSADQDEEIHEAVVSVTKTVNELTLSNLQQMSINPNAVLAVKAYCVVSNETISVGVVELEHQKKSKPQGGPKFLGDTWGVSQEDLVFFTVHTGSDSWKFTRNNKFVTGEFNPSDIIACRVDATNYWMDMVKEIMSLAKEFFPAEELKGATLSVWQWREQGCNKLIHERNFGEKVVQLKTIAPFRSPPEEQKDQYVDIPNVSDFKSKYLPKEFTVAEVMEQVVELFLNPDVGLMAKHDLDKGIISWELLFQGNILNETRTAVCEIMRNKGWTTTFLKVGEVVHVSILAHLKE